MPPGDEDLLRGDPLDNYEKLIAGKGGITIWRDAMNEAIDYLSPALLSPVQAGVLRAYVRHVNRETGLAWPAVEKQAHFAKLHSRKKVPAARRQLLQLGILRTPSAVGFPKQTDRVTVPGGSVKRFWVDTTRLLRTGFYQKAAFEAISLSARKGEDPAAEQLRLLADINAVPGNGVLTRVATPQGQLWEGEPRPRAGDLNGNKVPIRTGTRFPSEREQGSQADGNEVPTNRIREPYGSESRQGNPATSDRDLRRAARAPETAVAAAALPEIWDATVADFLGPWNQLADIDRRQLEAIARTVDVDLLRHVFDDATTYTMPRSPALLRIMLEQHRDQGCGFVKYERARRLTEADLRAFERDAEFADMDVCGEWESAKSWLDDVPEEETTKPRDEVTFLRSWLRREVQGGPSWWER